MQQQASLLAAAEAASASLDSAAAGSSAAQALFDICTRASSPSPAVVAAEFRRSPQSLSSAALLGQLHASRRAVWSSGAGAASASRVDSKPPLAVLPPPVVRSLSASALHDVSKPVPAVAHPLVRSFSGSSPRSSAGAAAVFTGRAAAPLHSSTPAAAARSGPDPAATPDSNFVCSIGVKGTEDGQFDAPWGVAVDEEGCIFVSEKNGNRVQVLQRSEENGQWIFTKKAGVQAPRGIACCKGTVVVALTDTHELLLKLDSTSLISSKKEWCHLGSGLLNNPNGVDIDSDRNIWIADTGNR